MRHMLHIPSIMTLANQQIFYGDAPAACTNWQVWRKPKNSNMLSAIVLSGGGGGGRGASAGAASTSAGGGGGGSSSFTSIVIPTILLPDYLYISVGIGSAYETAGIQSVIAVQPVTAVSRYTQILATATPGTAGNGGSGATAGAASSAVAATAITAMCLAARGTYAMIAGQVGSAGGGTAAASDQTIPATGTCVTGGAGGGGLAASGNGTNGGSIIGSSSLGLPGDSRPPATSNIYAAEGVGSAGAPTNGEDGQNWMFGGLQFIGGAGGASTPVSGTWTAGIGGIGGFGCGGGGGGGCFTGGTRGLGGRGGNGLVILTWW